MSLKLPHYRKDYIGESINSLVDGTPIEYFVEPRPNAFIPSNVDTAMIIGNGLTRMSAPVQKIIQANSRRASEAYKLMYACNRAVSDNIKYDYYVFKHRVFLSGLTTTVKNQVYLPYDMFLDYKEDCNLIPYVSYFDSGATAAYLAAFDGHKKIFLFGFDGDMGAGWQTVYDGSYPYQDTAYQIDMKCWEDYLGNVMSVYRDVEFYRVQMDGQSAPNAWTNLPNFKDVTLREAVLLGDF